MRVGKRLVDVNKEGDEMIWECVSWRDEGGSSWQSVKEQINDALIPARMHAGKFKGQLGDGASMYMGEVVGTDGGRWELNLKGAGRTPLSKVQYKRRCCTISVFSNYIRLSKTDGLSSLWYLACGESSLGRVHSFWYF